MALNLLKRYPELLEIMHLNDFQRTKSLRGVFNRDIENNDNFKYNRKPIFPVKKDGLPTMDTLFNHLTTRVDDKNISSRCFDQHRACRLHWLKFHIDKMCEISVFSYVDRIKRRGDVIRTYIFNADEQYVIILEPKTDTIDYYYLITAYYLNEKQGVKQIKSKFKNKLNDIY